MKITNKMVKEFDAMLRRGMMVPEIAKHFGVADTTVYHYTNEAFAERRRATWREYRRKKRLDPEFRAMELAATKKYLISQKT